MSAPIVLFQAISADRDAWYKRALAAEAALAAAPTRNPLPPTHEVVTSARALVDAILNGPTDRIFPAIAKLENALDRNG